MPESYDRVEFKDKCDKVYELVVDFAASWQKMGRLVGEEQDDVKP